MQERHQRQSNQARTQATRSALITAARILFIKKGYADTSTPEIVQAAGVTRGALYHHFTDKADLFRAVVHAEFEAVEAEIIASATQEPENAIDALMLGGWGYLNAMRKPGRVRLLLLDGPAVLGRLEMDAIDRETSADALRLGLIAAIESGEIKPLPLEELTVLLSAMFDRAALAVAEGDTPEKHLSIFQVIISALK